MQCKNASHQQFFIACSCNVVAMLAATEFLLFITVFFCFILTLYIIKSYYFMLLVFTGYQRKKTNKMRKNILKYF